MEIKNATTVHRLWGSLTDAELIAVFQYDTDAKSFCERCIEQQPKEAALIWVSHYDGKMNIVRHASKAAPATETSGA